MKKILSIAFIRETDTDPDLSFLGKYSNQPGPPDKTIDRQYGGSIESRYLRYFIAAMSAKDTGNPESVEQDYRRMEAYIHQEWWMEYCCAKATIVVENVIQTITSGGLGGVESDSEASYFEEIKREQLGDLAAILRELDFNSTEIIAAFGAIKS